MHKGGVMKSSFSAVNALKLGLHALRQNLLRSVATVALLAVCATAFGVFSSTLLDYGRKQEQLFALNPSATFALSKFDWSNYAVGQESLLEISSRLGFYASNAVVSFSADEISRLEARTGALFARIYYDPGMQTPVVGGDISRPAHWFWYADYDRRESLLAWNACVTELAGTEEAARNEYDLAYLAGQAAHRNGVDHFLDSEAYARSLAIACLPEEDIAGFGCSMLAGRMPQAADEIAVSECFYREFEARGYCLYDDIAAGEMIVPVYNDRYAEGYDPAKPDGYILNIDEIPSREEALVARIAAPEDLLGKALAVYGAGEGVAPGGSYRLMRVVGSWTRAAVTSVSWSRRRSIPGACRKNCLSAPPGSKRTIPRAAYSRSALPGTARRTSPAPASICISIRWICCTSSPSGVAFPRRRSSWCKSPSTC